MGSVKQKIVFCEFISTSTPTDPKAIYMDCILINITLKCRNGNQYTTTSQQHRSTYHVVLSY